MLPKNNNNHLWMYWAAKKKNKAFFSYTLQLAFNAVIKSLHLWY